MRFKIRGGTANHGEPSLCGTCRFATIIKGQRLRDEIVECIGCPTTHASPSRSQICTGYADRRQASLREMEETAWVLRSDPRRSQIGFVPARKFGRSPTSGKGSSGHSCAQLRRSSSSA